MIFKELLPPNVDYDNQQNSCLSYQSEEQKEDWSNLGQEYEQYSEDKTIIHQQWFNPEDFREAGYLLGIDIVTVSTIRQDPGNFIKPHRDTFFKIKNKFPERAKNETLVRANIFMEDAQPGHIITYHDIKSPIKNNWKFASNWKAGFGYLWDDKVVHLSTNAGLKPKFTMQISGFYKK